jgi:nucleoid-associated protein YgaU
MSRLRQVILVPLLALAAAYLPPAALTSVAAQGLVATVNIAADGDSGIAGSATLTELGAGRMAVELRLTGAGATPRPAHIHLGSCDALEIQAPSIPLQPAVNGASTSQIEATFQQLLSRPYAIHLHRSAEELGVYVACGDVKGPPPPPAPVVAAPEPQETLYTVVAGDSLSLIAQRVYGDLMQWPRLYQANQDRIGNPNTLEIGWVLRIPR